MEPRPWNIMGAPEPEERETRVLLDVGTDRMAVLCSELYHTAGESFAQTASHYRESVLTDFGVLPMEPLRLPGSPLQGMMYTSTVEDTIRAVAFLFGVLVVSPDRTLQQVLFFATFRRTDTVQGLRQLAQTITATLTVGPRRLNTAGGSHFIGADAASQLALDLPPGMVCSTQQGPDFEISTVHLLTPLGVDEGMMGIGLFWGDRPRLIYDQTASLVQPDTLSGELLGHPVTWLRWKVAEGKHGEVFYWEEGITLHPKVSDLYLHVYIYGATPQHRQRFRAVAESLRSP